MPKPTSLPRWADVGGKIVEPPGGKKDVGWVAEEKLPEGFLNWLLNLIYLWLLWLDTEIQDEPFDWTAPHTWTAQAGVDTPLAEFRDEDDNPRFLVDGNGFAMGSVMSWDHEWLDNDGTTVTANGTTSPVTLNSGIIIPWLVDKDTLAGNNNVRFYNAGDQFLPAGIQNIGSAMVRLERSTNTSPNHIALEHKEIRLGVGNLDDRVIILEQPIAIEADATGNLVNYFWGWTNHGWASLDTTANYEASARLVVQKKTGTANWEATAHNGTAGTTVDLGVAPVVDTWQLFKLEYHGKDTALGDGSDAVFRVFINGVLAGTIQDTNVPVDADITTNANRLRLGGVAFRTSGVPTAQMYVAGLKLRQNRLTP